MGSRIIVTRRGQPIAVFSAIDAEGFYDYVLAHAPEFVRGRQEADDAIARGELGAPLADVLAELDAEDRGETSSPPNRAVVVSGSSRSTQPCCSR